MFQFFLVLIIVALAFFILTRYLGIKKAFVFLSWIPEALLIFSLAYEDFAGPKTWLDAIWVLSFCASPILTVCGIVLMIRAYIHKTDFLYIFAATFLACLPSIVLIAGFLRWLREALY